jgi:hypothetical protein
MNQPGHDHQDLGAKWALKHRARQIARALADHPGAIARSCQTVELQILRRTPDQVLRVRHPERGDRLYLIEIQSRSDRHIGRRLAVASMALHQQTGLPVVPVVLYTGRVGKTRPQPVRYDVDGLLCHVPFREIMLADLDARSELERGPDSPWWPFIPYMKGGRNRAVLEPMIRRMASRRDQVDHLNSVLFMAGDVLEMKWVRGVLEGTMWDKVTGRHLRKGSLHHYLREKWVGEGEALGKAEEALRMVKRAVARRICLPDETLTRQLEALDLDRLESLVEEMAFLTTREDLDAWLERVQS